MLSILKTDFCKAFHNDYSGGAYFCNNIVLTLLIFCMGATTFPSTKTNENIFNFSHRLIAYPFLVILVLPYVFIAVIFTIKFVTFDFRCGTIENTASKGYPKVFIYLSKFITTLSFNGLPVFLIFMILSSSRSFDLCLRIARLLLMITSYISMAIFLSVIHRSFGYTLASFFLVNLIVPLIIETIICDFNSSIMLYTIAGAFLDSFQTIRGVIVLFAYTVITTAMGICVLKKRDIN